MQTIHDRVRALKKRDRVLTKEIANACGVSVPAVAGWMRSSVPNSRHLSLLAQFFNVSVDWLVHGELDAHREEIIAEMNLLCPMMDIEGLQIVRMMMRKLVYK
ncbi:helix-turn-helix domain-containing protein [Chromobacterium haemolyticum]|uniref:helix-turn-helix domain-containing protein n=1 Tax=Chromobacterium haemolyticum TaxID=394935 RepID=UPI0015E751DD|nr:helix-turn-helix transcriptional regulator [Chromobacterium haemolyticum]